METQSSSLKQSHDELSSHIDQCEDKLEALQLKNSKNASSVQDMTTNLSSLASTIQTVLDKVSTLDSSHVKKSKAVSPSVVKSQVKRRGYHTDKEDLSASYGAPESRWKRSSTQRK